MAGAAVGSVVPGVGTVGGAIVGGLAGRIGGGVVEQAAGAEAGRRAAGSSFIRDLFTRPPVPESGSHYCGDTGCNYC
ncbi:hypothetical protein [Xenorhabdus ehlersii]|uniref:Uncharacterized protein n=1 Tax=Xenorhabdus ehlersii TaxID=290111 RepID=A0A2D0IJG7_9GAMM|nr:hypothetical protein [Xenorhabdus ehlersii]PHM21893.1 hypothetical protein Xehl_04095 [Xenorhabdus ehlersii]RKE93057.1 hypothetical protein BDE27_0751 [Xenorhabdus ehlersii]